MNVNNSFVLKDLDYGLIFFIIFSIISTATISISLKESTKDPGTSITASAISDRIVESYRR